MTCQPSPAAGGEGQGQSYRSRSRLLSRTSLLSSEGGSDVEEKEPEKETETVLASAPAISPWVSHRTHREEQLGVDHVFLRVGGTERLRLEVYDTSVLPETLPCSAWVESFQLSDHRPVRATVAVVPLSNWGA